MPIEFGRMLSAAGLVAPRQMGEALLLSVVRGVPLVRALVECGAITEAALEQEIARRGRAPVRHVTVQADLWARLPPELCRRLGAVPTHFDATTGTADVAAVDPSDPHVGAEFAFHLQLDVRILWAPLGVVEEAIRRAELDASPEPRERRMTPRFPHGAPQSSTPPPSNEMPIPLVRRLGVPAVEDPETTEASTRRLGVAGEPDRDEVNSVRARTTATGVDSSPPPTDRAPDRRSQTLVSADLPPRSRHGRPIAPSPFGLAELPSPLLAASSSHEEAMIDHDTTVDPDRAPGSRPEAETLRQRAPGAQPQAAELRRPAIDAPRPVPRDGLPLLEAGRAQLGQAQTRDEVVAALIDTIDRCARGVAVFAARRDGFCGWACSGALGDSEALRRIVLPVDEPNILATAVDAGSYRGPIPLVGAQAALCDLMGSAAEVVIVPLRVRGRVALILVADGLDEAKLGSRGVQELARMAGAALEAMLTSR